MSVKIHVYMLLEYRVEKLLRNDYKHLSVVYNGKCAPVEHWKLVADR